MPNNGMKIANRLSPETMGFSLILSQKEKKMAIQYKLLFCVNLILSVLLLSQSSVFSYSYIGKGCTTAYSIDEDCDGYGVGAGYVTGPDADDMDPAVNTTATVEAKYGNITTAPNPTIITNLKYFLSATRNYSNIQDIYFIATHGNDGTGAKNDITKPYATFSAVYSRMGAGDLVLYRGGTYTNSTAQIGFEYGTEGTAGSPIIVMSFPGELAILGWDGGDKISIGGKHYIIIDTFQCGISSPTAGQGLYTDPSKGADHLTVRYVEFLNNYQGTRCQYGVTNTLLEKCVVHDNTGGGNHLNYWGGTNCYNQTFKDCIFYANRTGYPLFQWNGTGATNLRWEGCIFHSAGQNALALENGIDQSFIINCLFFNNNRHDIQFWTYSTDWFGVADNNQIINNTFWRGQYSNSYSNGNPTAVASITLSNSVDSTPLTGNIFRNNVWLTSSPIFSFNRSTTAAATYIDHDVMYRQSGSTIATVGGSSYTFSQFEDAWTNTNSNMNGDPLFEDVSVDYYSTPSKFDFDLSENSPAMDFGTSIGAPPLDLRGKTRSGIPDAGCYEYGSGGPSPPKNLRIEEQQ